MTTTTNIATFRELLTFLDASEVSHRVDEAIQIVELPSSGPELPSSVYLRWERHVPFIQLIQFMLESVPAERIREIETAIVRLDNVLEVGGFGLDHERRHLYCRLTVPVFQPEGIVSTTLVRLVAGVVENAAQYVESFRRVVAGESGDRIVMIVREIEAARNAHASRTGP